ncbi:UV excision repair protein rhp23 [Wickerhamiella sorbophila]|uniref:UV excision repair protein RAD23 n=1 Tax=Wickerhamiella sorbophila TaxID=45607 RepID=A0A2T0FKH7_9ASCO|nr:UV excision repair protein rhp23 [Wickerhamiella sorbophila]PRT55479.1 UV excision repair protein rhp23 [Wickerhamiella sorbophila]
MKLSFRDLKHEKWSIEVDESDTVRQVKEKNASARGFGADQSQKLIYSGKILKDDDAISSYKIQPEKDFIVCMVHKAKKAKSVSPASTVASSTSATSSAAAAPVESGLATTPTPSEPAAPPADAASVLAKGSELEEITSKIVNMGYERAQVMTALRMAFNNPDRAVEYLVTGMVPETSESSEHAADDVAANQPVIEAPTRAAEEPAPTAAAGAGEDTTDINLFEAAGRQTTEDEEDVEFMRRYDSGLPSGQIETFRQMIRENPGVFEPVIQQLVAQNPQLGEVIRENPDALFQLLQGADELDLPGDEEEEEGGVPGGAWRLEITPEENDAINRLMELGFDRSIVIQAYFACDKNEELAANYLFEHGYDD